MYKINKNGETFLGDIETRIVGMQYYEGNVHPGETVHLEREPKNPHDSHTIRVENEDFDQAGNLPRRVVSWLAPLIDEGRVRVDGRIPTGSAPKEHEAPVTLDMYLCKRGSDILATDSCPEDGPHALHRAVLLAHKDAGNWACADAVRTVGERLKGLSKRDVLPETKLLLALFPSLARDIRKKQAETAVAQTQEALRKIKVGPATHYHNLTLFPLFVDNGHEPGYMLLEEAIESGVAEVREVSEEGSVPELTVVNRGDRPILITEGEILTGAKQNRMVNITVLVAAACEFTLPVSCVEQGRWKSVSNGFWATHYAPPGMRARKNADVRESRARDGSAHSDQGHVWEDVACCLREMGVDSETDSLTDGYEAVREKLEDYRKNLPLPDGAAGVLVGAGEQIVGTDLFDSPQTFNKLWPRLSESYFFEAAVGNKKRRRTLKRKAREFVASMAEGVRTSSNPVGLGTELDVAAQNHVGSALWHDSRICHLSAMALREHD